MFNKMSIMHTDDKENVNSTVLSLSAFYWDMQSILFSPPYIMLCLMIKKNFQQLNSCSIVDYV